MWARGCGRDERKRGEQATVKGLANQLSHRPQRHNPIPCMAHSPGNGYLGGELDGAQFTDRGTTIARPVYFGDRAAATASSPRVYHATHLTPSCMAYNRPGIRTEGLLRGSSRDRGLARWPFLQLARQKTHSAHIADGHGMPAGWGHRGGAQDQLPTQHIHAVRLTAIPTGSVPLRGPTT